MAVQFSSRFAEHESFGMISGSSWILLYLCQSVHLSTAPSAAVPFRSLTNWSALNGGGDVLCPESEFYFLIVSQFVWGIVAIRRKGGWRRVAEGGTGLLLVCMFEVVAADVSTDI